MVKSRRVFTREFNLAAVKELESDKLGYVARQLEVNPNTLHRWRREFRETTYESVLRSRQAATVKNAVALTHTVIKGFALFALMEVRY